MQNTAPFATTLDYADDLRWRARARELKYVNSVLSELRLVARILWAARREKALLLNSSTGRLYPDLLAAVVTGLWPRRWRPATVLMGCMWQYDGGLWGLLQRLIVRLADRGIDLYAVQSTEELTLFPRLWRVEAAKIRFCPFCSTVTERDLNIPSSQPGSYIFSGGNPCRDYDTLLAVARCLPEYQFVIATIHAQKFKNIPPNVRIEAVSHPEFMGLMQHAAAVVVPVRTGLTRAVGQQTYLNAMWFGRPTIVTDSPAVRDHIVDRKTGFIVQPTVESLVETLRWVLDSANQQTVKAISKAGQVAAQTQFTFENHVQHLLSILDEAIALRA